MDIDKKDMDNRKTFYMENVYPLHRDVYRVLFHIICDPHGAEELTQEVMEKAWHGLDSLRDSQKVKPWVFGILRNTVRSYMKQRSRAELALEQDDIAEALDERSICRTEADLLESLVEKENRQRILKALDRIEPKYQRVIRLSLILEIPLKEIAEIEQIRYDNARQIYARGLKKLRREYEALEEGGADI